MFLFLFPYSISNMYCFIMLRGHLNFSFFVCRCLFFTFFSYVSDNIRKKCNICSWQIFSIYCRSIQMLNAFYVQSTVLGMNIFIHTHIYLCYISLSSLIYRNCRLWPKEYYSLLGEAFSGHSTKTFKPAHCITLSTLVHALFFSLEKSNILCTLSIVFVYCLSSQQSICSMRTGIFVCLIHHCISNV